MDRNAFIHLLLGAVYTLGAAASLGQADGTLLGVELLGQATEIGGYALTNYNVGQIVALGGAWAIAQPSWSSMDGLERGLVGVAVVAILVSILSPETLHDLAAEASIALILLGIKTGGYWAIAHK